MFFLRFFTITGLNRHRYKIISVVLLVLLSGCIGSNNAGSNKQYVTTITQSVVAANTPEQNIINSRLEFINAAEKYESIGVFKELGGKIAYTAKKGGKWYAIYDGRIISPGCPGIRDIILLNGKIGLIISNAETSRDMAGNNIKSYAGIEGYSEYLYYEGSSGPSAERITDYVVSDGKIGYVLSADNMEASQTQSFYYDGRFSRNYSAISNVRLVNDKIFYGVRDNNRTLFVYDGKEVKDLGYGGSYYILGDNIDYNLRYYENNSFVNILTVNGKTTKLIGYDEIRRWDDINGKLAFETDKYTEDGKYKSIIFFDSDEISEDNKTVYYPIELNGKLAYLSCTTGKRYYHGGKETPYMMPSKDGFCGYEGLDYDVMKMPEDGCVIKDSLDCAVKVDGQIYDTVDGSPKGMKNLNGTLLIVSIRDGKYYVKYRNTSSGGYDEVGSSGYDIFEGFIAINGKLAYLARKGDNRILVYDGLESTFCNQSYEPLLDLDGKLAYFCYDNKYNYGNLIYDGKIIGSSVNPETIKLVRGKLSFSTGDDRCEELMYDGSRISRNTTESQDENDLREVSGYIVYDLELKTGCFNTPYKTQLMIEKKENMPQFPDIT
jgi:hypothetical protein